MEDQQKIRYRLLSAALEKSDTIEQAVMATTGMLNFVITGRLDGQSPPESTEATPSRPRKKRAKRKGERWSKNKYLRQLGAEHYQKFLEAMIAIKEGGQQITITRASEIVLGKRHPEINTAVSKYLVKHGYAEVIGRGRRTRWTILKNPDGTPYEPKIFRAAPAEAQGYGWTQKLGDIATVKQ